MACAVDQPTYQQAVECMFASSWARMALVPLGAPHRRDPRREDRDKCRGGGGHQAHQDPFWVSSFNRAGGATRLPVCRGRDTSVESRLVRRR